MAHWSCGGQSRLGPPADSDVSSISHPGWWAMVTLRPATASSRLRKRVVPLHVITVGRCILPAAGPDAFGCCWSSKQAHMLRPAGGGVLSINQE